jgi:hypothetical protein
MMKTWRTAKDTSYSCEQAIPTIPRPHELSLTAGAKEAL